MNPHQPNYLPHQQQQPIFLAPQHDQQLLQHQLSHQQQLQEQQLQQLQQQLQQQQLQQLQQQQQFQLQQQQKQLQLLVNDSEQNNIQMPAHTHVTPSPLSKSHHRHSHHRHEPPHQPQQPRHLEEFHPQTHLELQMIQPEQQSSQQQQQQQLLQQQEHLQHHPHQSRSVRGKSPVVFKQQQIQEQQQQQQPQLHNYQHPQQNEQRNAYPDEQNEPPQQQLQHKNVEQHQQQHQLQQQQQSTQEQQQNLESDHDKVEVIVDASIEPEAIAGQHQLQQQQQQQHNKSIKQHAPTLTTESLPQNQQIVSPLLQPLLRKPTKKLRRDKAHELLRKRILVGTLVAMMVATILWLVAFSINYWASWEFPDGVMSANKNVIRGQHAGLWKMCREEVVPSTNEKLSSCIFMKQFPTSDELIRNQKLYDATVINYRRSCTAIGVIGVLVMVLSIISTYYSTIEPRYIYKRLAGSLLLGSAACILVCVEIIQGSLEYERKYLPHMYPPKSKHRFGFCFGVAWFLIICFLVFSLILFFFSRKQKDKLVDDRPVIIGRI
ncbi:hypothetical protein HELRODRAFT_192895 [Helobdella robusta]|uniref:Uncharacterized protein n=1 Tax=Helobdella robusta TaxID=6412 RepID=T1FUE2_HELRO|nr:hypothetical protein HELRODRAFT_192895 [Helobdella robusta]ESN99659.1 hypothetical protein HELRODRAFT_192895 [Helobdella robusta]